MHKLIFWKLYKGESVKRTIPQTNIALSLIPEENNTTRAGMQSYCSENTKHGQRRLKWVISREKSVCPLSQNSKAMHFASGRSKLVYIRDILGHVSIQTTRNLCRIHLILNTVTTHASLEKAYVWCHQPEEPISCISRSRFDNTWAEEIWNIL